MTNDVPAGTDGIKSDAIAASSAPPPGGAGRGTRLALAGAAVAAVVLGGALAVYGTGLAGSKDAGGKDAGSKGSVGKGAARVGACARSLDAAAAIDPLVQGEVAALIPAKAAHDLSGIGFNDAEGAKTSLAAFKGRTVLLNLWATWCVPCRAEMPALDKLQATMGSAAFAVVPVDVDQTRLERARGFFKEIGTPSLPFYADPSADILRTLGAKGLPTTVLVGADGCEIATMAGPAQWDSGDGRAVIGKALDVGAGAKPPG